MKLNLTLLAVTGMLAAAACKKDNDKATITPVLVNKTISFTVKANESYSGAAYNNAFVEIKLGIFKVKPSGEHVTLLDTTLGVKPFRSLDFQGEGIKVSKLIKDLDRDKENLSYSFVRSTLIDGQRSMYAGNTFLMPDETSKNVLVSF